MYLSDFLRVLGRRWYLVLLGVILTTVASVGVVRLISPTYEADATVLLIGPSVTVAGDKNVPVNAYLRLDAGLRPIRDVATQVLMDPRSQAQFLASAPTSTYTVAPTPLSTAPMLTFVVKSKNPAEASALSETLLTSLDQTLAGLQKEAAAPAQLLVTNRVVSQSAPYPLKGNQLRAALAVGALGLIISLLLPFLAESASRRRSRRDELDFEPADFVGNDRADGRAEVSH